MGRAHSWRRTIFTQHILSVVINKSTVILTISRTNSNNPDISAASNGVNPRNSLGSTVAVTIAIGCVYACLLMWHIKDGKLTECNHMVVKEGFS